MPKKWRGEKVIHCYRKNLEVTHTKLKLSEQIPLYAKFKEENPFNNF